MGANTVFLLTLGLVTLVIGAEALVRSASRLASAAGVSPLVIGLTVVSLGTSAPEIAVGVQAALADQGDLTVGNVVGSNIFNILFILGLTALVSPLVVSQQLLRLDVPLMIAASLLVWLLSRDGSLNRWEGGLLLCGAVGYTVLLYSLSRRESQEVREEYAQEFGEKPPGTGRSVALQIGLLLLGLALLVLGANWIVEGAVALAKSLGVSDLLIGLTIIAVGTSLPEVATSVMASYRGERDIAVGNAIGSNLSNLLVVLGLSGIVAPFGVPVSAGVLSADFPIMTAAAVACLPIFFIGHRIHRWEGGLFLGYYLAYLLYLLLSATGRPGLRSFQVAMLGFVLPLTVLTLLILVYRTWRRNHQEAKDSL